MPDPKRSAADEEVLGLLNSPDTLPVVSGKLPAVADVVAQKSPDADAEVRALLAGNASPRPATAEEANSDVMPAGGKVTELPVQDIQGEVPKPAPAPWYSKLLPQFPQQTKDFNPGDPKTDPNYAQEAAGMHHMENVAQHPGMQMLASAAVPATAAAPVGLIPSAVAGGMSDAITAAADNNDIRDAAVNGAVLGGALGGGSQLAAGLAKKAIPFSDRLMTQTFMTPAQRAIYARQHGGSDALRQLGADARSAGLYKPTNWLDYLHPTTARRVAENAERVQGTAGQAIGDFEDKLAAQGVNPDVNVAPIAKGLRDEASSNLAGVPDPKAARDAAHFTNQADLLENSNPIQTSASKGQAQIGMNDAEELAAANNAPPPVSVTRDSIPFTEAMKTKRYMANQIKWGQNPQAPGVDYGEDAARRFAWSGLKGNIQNALQGSSEIPKEDLLGYFKNNKDFSTAATVQQPAMKMAERAGETGLGLSDLMAGAAMGAPTAVASRFARGMAPSTIANVARGGGYMAQGAANALGTGARVAPIVAAQKANPGAPKGQIEKEANTSLKNQVKNWFDSLLR